jgi:hypothetical protein
MQKAVANMVLIQQLFQASAMAASETMDDATLIASLEQNDKTFISIAYEASAMERALLDFNANDFAFSHWQAFLQLAPQHSTQIYIGLGWAIAKRRITIEQVEAVIKPLQLPRVLDGIGYCEGTFKQRLAVKEMKTPEWLNGNLRKGYDQGLGRSLWYTAKGNPDALNTLIEPFPENRKSDLWRGVGIAVSYVGGSDESEFQTIFKLAKENQVQLAIGAVLAASSRKEANAITKDLEIVCETWCGITLENALQLVAETKVIIQNENYFEWLELLKQKLQS